MCVICFMILLFYCIPLVYVNKTYIYIYFQHACFGHPMSRPYYEMRINKRFISGNQNILCEKICFIIIIFITYTPGTNKHTHEKNKIFFFK